MSAVLAALDHHAQQYPKAVALVRDDQRLTYQDVALQLEAAALVLAMLSDRTIAIAVRHPLAWLITDLAVIGSALPSVPLPAFFTHEQQCHAMQVAGAGWLITDERREDYQPAYSLELAQTLLWVYALPYAPVALHEGTAKITFTSGTTATPKGVCLSLAAMEDVAQSLLDVLGAEVAAHHASMLPLEVLLENVAGFYTTLLAGGCYHVKGAHPMPILAWLQQTQATSCILVPELLRQLLQQLAADPAALPHLRYAAVGGAKVSLTLLQQAAQHHVPVYQGYGLSELASVACLNTPDDQRLGSVGKPLPHIRLQVAEDGELLLHRPLYLGYVGEGAAPALYPTGDIGRVDDAGYVWVTGRKKHVLITSLGRNISPEWPEAELLAQPAIAQAVVVGDAQPWLAALLVSDADEATVAQAMNAANAALPDYAQIRQWQCVAPFTVANGCLTANGRPKRTAIASQYAATIDSFFHQERSDDLIFQTA